MSPARTVSTALLLAAALSPALPVRAEDDWDLVLDGDGGPSTDNALFHGAVQEHSLDTGPTSGTDEDWYLVTSHPMSSYEVVIDGLSGDLDLTGTDVQRLDGATQVQQSAAFPDGPEGPLSLAWRNLAPTASQLGYVRVTGAACAPDCRENDRYRIRYFDTTYTIARFNNTGSQSTVLLIRNTTPRPCGATVFYLNESGGLIGVNSLDLVPSELRVLGPSVQPSAQAGSVRVAHVCGYGALAGKAVSIEPSAGFAFDTDMVARPR